MVTTADSAEAIPAGARINPQAAAANATSMSSVARMAGLRSSVWSMSAGSTGGGRRGFKGNSKTLSGAENDPAAGAVRPGLSRLFPGAALSRHRDSLLHRFFGVRGAIVVNHGEFVERIHSTHNGVHLVAVDRLGPSADNHRRDRVTGEVGHRAGF